MPSLQVLMGQKYGYRPIPAFIEAEEFEGMRGLLPAEGEARAALDRWYVRDDNAVPAQYVLQPIDSVLTDYHSSVSRQSEHFGHVRKK